MNLFSSYLERARLHVIQETENDEEFGKSLKILHVSKVAMDRIHEKKKLLTKDIPDENLNLYPNQPLILKNSRSSCLTLVSKDCRTIDKIDQEASFFRIKGRNKEQKILMNILQDREIRCIIVTGPAGTGKTTIIGSYLLEEVLEKKEYDKMILSKPLEIVTRTRYWGTVPGDEQEKFDPFLKSYQIMFEDMVGNRGKGYIRQAMEAGDIDFLPLELMRGASLKECLCWYDEAQNLNYHECNSLGSRIDDEGGSKLILSGDLNQRDRNIDKQNTGLMKVAESPAFLNSPLTAHVHLTQNERGKISQLFHDIFDEEE